MSSGSFMQADVLCPFYLTDTDKPINIRCEGISDDNRLVLNFRHKNEKLTHMKAFCTDNYCGCVLFKAINEKYED